MNKRLGVSLLLSGLIGFGLAGCKSDEQRAADRAALAANPKPVRYGKNSAPPGTKFARVKIGQTMKEVEAQIGKADVSKGHLMGKNFNPFYWGSDRYHTIWFYKGQGRITFNIKAKVMLFEYDPTEPAKKD